MPDVLGPRTYSEEYEIYVLTAMLQEDGLAGRLESYLRPDDFYHPLWRALYSLCLDIHRAGVEPDFPTVFSALQQRNRGPGQKPDEDGLLNACLQMAQYPARRGTEELAWEIVGMAEVRRLQESLLQTGQDMGQGAGLALTVPEAVAKVQEAVKKAKIRARPEAGLATSSSFVGWVSDQWQRAGHMEDPVQRHVRTGFSALDRSVFLKLGEATLLSGRAKEFKSALALHLAVQALRDGRAVQFFSLEMDRETVFSRLAAHLSGVDLAVIRRGTAGHENWEKIWNAATAALNWQFLLSDDSGLSLADIIGRAETWAERFGGPYLLLLDYTDLVQERPLRDERYDQVLFRICREMRNLGKRLNAHVVILHQLQDPAAGRKPRPTRADLANAKSLTRMVDNSLLLWIPERYPEHEGQAQFAGKAEIVIDAQRNGPTGSVWVGIDKTTGRFTDLLRSEWPALT